MPWLMRLRAASVRPVSRLARRRLSPTCRLLSFPLHHRNIPRRHPPGRLFTRSPFPALLCPGERECCQRWALLWAWPQDMLSRTLRRPFYLPPRREGCPTAHDGVALGDTGSIGIGAGADRIRKKSGGKTCSSDYSLDGVVEEVRVERGAEEGWGAIALAQAPVESASALTAAIPLLTRRASPATG